MQINVERKHNRYVATLEIPRRFDLLDYIGAELGEEFAISATALSQTKKFVFVGRDEKKFQRLVTAIRNINFN